MKYLLGIDEGSQSCKLTIYDADGRIVCRASEPLSPMYIAPDGVVEHPGDDLWDKLCIASKKLMAEFKGDPKDIAAAGLCTIRFCRALLKADGTLAQPVMSWMDSRVSRPHEWVNSDTQYVTTSSGYVTCRLTGEFRDTTANYLGVWPLDKDAWDYHADDSALRQYNLERENLLSLRAPGEILGYVTPEAANETGLPVGLPVAATANDKAVEALGAGCLNQDSAIISLGTYIAAMTPGESNRPDTQNMWVNLACMPNKYLYESNGVRRGMWMLSWWTKFIGDEFLAECQRRGEIPEVVMGDEAGSVPPGSDGLLILPHWLAPTSHPFRKGIMMGFDARHGRAHVFRAIMESIAMTIKNCIDAMCNELGRFPEEFVVTGGGSNSPLFMQIFADVLNKPVSRAYDSGPAGLGSAICAAVASGVHESFHAAVAAMVRKGEGYSPIADSAELYDRLNNEVFKNLTDIGDEVLKKTYSIFG